MFKKWMIRAGALGLTVVVLAALTLGFAGFASSAHAANGPKLPVFKNLTPKFTTVDLGSILRAAGINSGGSTIPNWSSSFSFGGKTYPYTMVGTNPTLGSATSKIPVEIIPIDVSFASGITFDATNKVPSTIASPIFRRAQFTSGNTQYGDAIQRQELWSEVSTVSKQYHVLLDQPVITPTLVANVPVALGKAGVTTAGTIIGLVDENWWSSQMGLWLRQLKIRPDTLPIFLTYNILVYFGAILTTVVQLAFMAGYREGRP